MFSRLPSWLQGVPPPKKIKGAEEKTEGNEGDKEGGKEVERQGGGVGMERRRAERMEE